MSFPFRGFHNPLNLFSKCFISIFAFHVFNITRLFEVVNYTRSIIYPFLVPNFFHKLNAVSHTVASKKDKGQTYIHKSDNP